MTIIPLLLLCSLALVVGSLVLFVFSAKQGDCHEAERLCLMPLEDDTAAAGDGPASAADTSSSTSTTSSSVTP